MALFVMEWITLSGLKANRIISRSPLSRKSKYPTILLTSSGSSFWILLYTILVDSELSIFEVFACQPKPREETNVTVREESNTQSEALPRQNSLFVCICFLCLVVGTWPCILPMYYPFEEVSEVSSMAERKRGNLTEKIGLI